MDPIGISELTGLDLRAAGRAARREFDEPFVYLSRSRELRRRVRALAARCDLVVTRGGRFDHLHGKTDKGVAVRRVRELVEASAGPLRMVALGDSPMDLAFLSAAEVPIIVPGPDGRPNRLLRRRLPAARTAPAPGPAGWAAAIHCALDDAGLDGN
jgi:mannosyl-3-phosphoglycerate phosphatase